MVDFNKLTGTEPLETSNNAPLLITKGMVFTLANVTVVTVAPQPARTWDCVVIRSTSEYYPVGGYNINILEKDLRGGSPHYPDVRYIPQDQIPS